MCATRRCLEHIAEHAGQLRRGLRVKVMEAYDGGRKPSANMVREEEEGRGYD